MGSTLRAIETSATIDERHHLQLDEPLSISGPRRVRVIILISESDDIDEDEWLRAAAMSPSFDFLRDPAEDIYTLADGRPFRSEDRRDQG